MGSGVSLQRSVSHHTKHLFMMDQRVTDEIEDRLKTLVFDKVSFDAVVDLFVTEGECLYAMVPKIEKPLNLAHPSQPVLKGDTGD